MRFYPLFLDLSGKDVLVVGAGKVGQRKVASLVETPVRRILVLDPDARQEAALPQDDRIHFAGRTVENSDFPGKALVFAATGNAEVNGRLAAACAALGIWCNSITQPAEGDFFVPAHFARDDLTIAVSTGGNSPALAAKIRKDLEAWTGNRYTPLLSLLRRLRPLLLELRLPAQENAAVFRRIINELPEDLFTSPPGVNGDGARLKAALRPILPPALHGKLGELVHEL